jgi:hypothetical protein
MEAVQQAHFAMVALVVLDKGLLVVLAVLLVVAVVVA